MNKVPWKPHMKLHEVKNKSKIIFLCTCLSQGSSGAEPRCLWALGHLVNLLLFIIK